MNFQQIFFDLDDTLVDTRNTIYKRIDFLLDEFQLEIDSNKIYDLLGFEDRDNRLKEFVRNPEDFWGRYEQLRKDVKVSSIPGVKQTVERLYAENTPLGIITNNGREKTLEKLAFVGIDSNIFTSGIYSCSENNYYKPSPEIAKLMGLPKEKVLYVGDDLIDYEFAQNIGADFFGICSGFHDKHDFLKRGLGAERIFPSIREAFK